MSRHRHDDLSKLVLQLWLAPLGSVTLDARIAGEARRGDVLFVEKRHQPEHRDKLGLLGELAHGTTLFEPFRNPPTLAELQSCVAKRIELLAQVLRAARRAGKPAEHAKPPVVVVVAPSFSSEKRRECGIHPKKTGGVYPLVALVGCVIVVACELPANRQTLWLRLLGRGAVQRRAIAELLASVKRETLADATMRLILEWRASLPPVEEQSPEEREQMEIWERYYNKFHKELRDAFQEGKAEGKAEGKTEGKAEAVLAVLDGRGLKTTEARRKRILACQDDVQLDHWLLRSLTVTSVAELLRPTRKPAARSSRASRTTSGSGIRKGR